MLSGVETPDLSMRELKDELASLRIERDEPRRRRGRIPLLLLILVAVLVAGGFYYQRAHPLFGAIEVETFQPTIETSSTPGAGTPILTASGYLVARHQSVVSSKIQGRISALRVEEGSIVNTGDVLATLDNQDAVAAIAKAKADIEYAKADLAEAAAPGAPAARNCSTTRSFRRTRSTPPRARSTSPRPRSSRTKPTCRCSRPISTSLPSARPSPESW